MILLAAFIATAPAAEPPTAPTIDPAGFLLRPEFRLAGAKVPAGGLAFAIEADGERYALTAFQLLGPPSGVTQATPAQVKQGLDQVALSDLGSGMWLVNSGAPLVTSLEVVGQTASKDVLVLPLATPKDKMSGFTTGNRTTLKPGALASEGPKKGDPIWMVAPLPNSPDAGFLHLGTIADLNGDFLFYDVSNNELDLAGTSGAPLVNAEGKVVGMQVGVIRFEDGGLAGSAVPLSALEARMAEGKANKPAPAKPE